MVVAMITSLMGCVKRRQAKDEALKEVYSEVLHCLRELSSAPDAKTFQVGYLLFRQKFPNLRDFHDWWEAEGRGPGGENSTWTYAYVPAGIPTTNNALESWNRFHKGRRDLGLRGNMRFFEGLEALGNVLIDQSKTFTDLEFNLIWSTRKSFCVLFA